MMIKVIIKKKSTISAFIILILIFALFICMIYFEIIVFSCCAFEVDTINEIGKRATKEKELLGNFIKERKLLYNEETEETKETAQINLNEKSIN